MRALMEHAQPRQSVSIRTSKYGLPTFMLGDTPDVPSTGYTLPAKQGHDSHLHPLDTVEVARKLEEALLSESNPTIDDPHKLPRQHDMSGRQLLQD